MPRSVTLGQLLSSVRKRQERSYSYSVYWSGESPAPQLDHHVLVAPPATVTENDKEVLPECVTEASYELLCRDELLQDVVDHAQSQRPGISEAELCRALIHYLDHDDFLDFDP